MERNAAAAWQNPATLSDLAAQLARRDPSTLLAVLAAQVGASFERGDPAASHWAGATGQDTRAETALRRILPAGRRGYRAAEHVLELRAALRCGAAGRVAGLVDAAIDELWWDGTEPGRLGAQLCAALWGRGEAGQLAGGLAPHWDGDLDTLADAVAALAAAE